MFRDTLKVVKEILEEDKKARNDDKYLICRYLDKKGLPTDLKELNSPVSFETITRARRKLQESCPHLRATKKARRNRQENEEDIKVNVLDRGC